MYLAGSNSDGALGNGSTTNSSFWVQTVPGGNNWSSVSSSSDNASAINGMTAAVKRDGTLWVWGYNATGSLGLNATGSRSSPIQTVAGGTDWRTVECLTTNTMLATKQNGTLWAWGYNAAGVYGDGTLTTRSSPVQVGSLNTWSTEVTGGYNMAMAIQTDGTLWKTGSDNNIGSSVSTWTQIGTDTTWKTIKLGMRFGGGIKTDGTLWMAGSAALGQLGRNNITNSQSFVQTVAGGTDWKQLSCGHSHTLALKTNGTLWTWGLNTSGQLGLGDTTNRSSPVQVGSATDWVEVCAGMNSSWARKSDSSIYSWGNNATGQLAQGNTTNLSTPTQIPNAFVEAMTSGFSKRLIAVIDAVYNTTTSTSSTSAAPSTSLAP